MRQLYELDSPNYDTMESLDPMCPALWRYRTRVSVDHLIVKFREFSSECIASPPVCEVLKEFIEKVRVLIFLDT